MTQRNRESKLKHYKCGRCRRRVRYLVTEGKPEICKFCGWDKKERSPYSVPHKFKLEIT